MSHSRSVEKNKKIKRGDIRYRVKLVKKTTTGNPPTVKWACEATREGKRLDSDLDASESVARAAYEKFVADIQSGKFDQN